MADFPATAALGLPPVFGTPQCVPELASLGATGASTAWPSANLAIFIPFRLSAPFLAAKLLVENGATASGNIDAGIYDAAGTRLVSIGSTAQSGTTAIQSFDITDTTLNVGNYYLALAMDNTTGTVHAHTPAAGIGRALGVLQMASAFVLPAAATFAALASAYVPGVYVTGQTVI